MPLKKGVPRHPLAGRKKGVQNKMTRTVKETVLAVFNELQDDPKVKLKAWAKEQPTEFYKIAAKLIPTEIGGSVNITAESEIFIGGKKTGQ